LSDAFSKCVFNQTKMLKKNIDEFYNCTNEYLLANCVVIQPTDECSETLIVFEKCKGIVPDCSAWPNEVMLPEFCCLFPPLITEKLRRDYRARCSGKSHRENAMCVKSMMDKKFKPAGTFDYGEIKATLRGNVNHTNPRIWDTEIENAVNNCKTLIEGSYLLYLIYIRAHCNTTSRNS
jgi:hypothetical protein